MSGPQGTGTWHAGASRGTTRIRWSAWRMASNPSGGFLQVRRKLGAPRRRSRNGDRSISWLCSWIVLVAEVDERRLVQVSSGRPRRGHRHESVGSSLPASCPVHVLGGERVSEAGSRRQSREHGGGLSMILYLQAFVKAAAPEWARAREVEAKAEAARTGERALVEERRPGVGEAVVFDETAAEAVPGGFAREGSAERSGRLDSGLRHGASEATSQARLAVENAAAGRCSA